jgi:hypothetical protein
LASFWLWHTVARPACCHLSSWKSWHASCSGCSASQDWQPRTQPKASLEGLCLLLRKPETVSLQCPAQRLFCPQLLCWGLSPQQGTNWVAMPQAKRRAKKLSTTKEREPQLNWNICFLCNAFQTAWYCLPSKSIPSNLGGNPTPNSHQCLR